MHRNSDQGSGIVAGYQAPEEPVAPPMATLPRTIWGRTWTRMRPNFGVVCVGAAMPVTLCRTWDDLPWFGVVLPLATLSVVTSVHLIISIGQVALERMADQDPREGA